MPYLQPHTFDEILAKLSYDPDSGLFMWKVDVGKSVKAGSQAGAVKATRVGADGKTVSYRYIRLEGRTYPAARLAWLLTHGKWPTGKITPKNGDTLDLRAENLSEGFALVSEYDWTDPEQRRQYHRDRRHLLPEARRGEHLQATFGIDFQTYMRMAVAQHGVCGICSREETATRNGQVKALAVDHNHATNQIRGLLCQTCNQMVGFSKDDPAKLRAAADYLEKHAKLADNVVPLKEPG